MGLLKPMERKPGYLKAGFFGFTKSGKTFTAVGLAIGTRKFFGLNGPIAFFDTEDGAAYIAPIVKRETGLDLLVFKGRSFDKLKEVARECIKEGVSVLIVDSITHVWRELMAAYAEKKGRSPSLMPISDIMHIKELWAPWPDFYLTSPLHLIVCGRAGYEWDMRENEETGKMELVKQGTKMKVETEFGFEASLLVEMERINTPESGISRRATIIGDRFGAIDGHSCENPTFDFFRPHVQLLNPNGHESVDVQTRSDPNVDSAGDTQWAREKKQRTIFCEEIQGALVSRFPSQTASDKAAKAALVYGLFDTRSWTRVESMQSEALQVGLKALRELLADAQGLADFLERAASGDARGGELVERVEPEPEEPRPGPEPDSEPRLSKSAMATLEGLKMLAQAGGVQEKYQRTVVESWLKRIGFSLADLNTKANREKIMSQTQGVDWAEQDMMTAETPF